MKLEFVTPIDPEELLKDEQISPTALVGDVFFNEGNELSLDDIDIAIIGVEEDRESFNNKGSATGPNHVRRQLYKLNKHSFNTKIIDLGNIKKGASIKDTYFAVSSVLFELHQNQVIPIVIGGSHDLTLAQFESYEKLNKTINVTVIDEKIDIVELGKKSNANYLMQVLSKDHDLLFNYVHLGYQSFYVDDKILSTLEKLKFECYRLGDFKNNIEETEVIIRDTDLLSIDMSSVKQADSPAHMESTPNGFYSEDICQISRYAGISDKVSSFGIYEINPLCDIGNQTAQLASQMIWYFIDGFYFRHHEKPINKNTEYFKYVVDLKESEYQLVFWKSKKSGRWWMELPFSNDKMRYKRHHLVSCSYNDYQLACNGDVPNRWINAYEKLV